MVMVLNSRFFVVLGIIVFVHPILGQRRNGRQSGNATRNGNESGIQCLTVAPNTKCPDGNIKFTLYNRKLGKKGINITSPSDYLPRKFKPTDSIKVILHGLIIEYLTPELYDIKNDYLKKSDCHVLFVHYEPYAHYQCYSSALANIEHVGRCVAQFLSEFIVRFGLKDIHIITYSLGSHTANYIARAMRPLKLKRITALDPPALFVPDGNKLSVADAEFIDSFYTSALTLGQTRGHAAFYFNGGFIQPGCYLGMCSHSRAVDYYKESILSPVGFYGTSCDSYFAFLIGLCEKEEVIAGDSCPSTARGVYFVNTNNNAPFALGRRLLKKGD